MRDTFKIVSQLTSRRNLSFNEGGVVAHREAWWLNGSVPDCCPAVPGLNPASPQATADCQSPGGLPPGMALGCGLTSVRGNRGENYENEPLVHQKNIKKKKSFNEFHPYQKEERNFSSSLPRTLTHYLKKKLN
jgi:hypothetical protein